MNIANKVSTESQVDESYHSETEGYLLPLLGLPFNTPCLIFNCDFIDGSTGAWVSTDVTTPLNEQVQSYLQSRRSRGFTTDTTFGIYSFHCRDLSDAVLVGKMLGAPNGSMEEIILNNEIEQQKIKVSLAFCDPGAAIRISSYIDQIDTHDERGAARTRIKKGFGFSGIKTSCSNG
jgi:hypothetical protein